MIGLILKVIAAILFLVAAVNESFLEQGPADLVAWGLFAWVLGELLGPAWVMVEKRRGG